MAVTARIGHAFDPTILREYDIRGIYGVNLTEDDAFALGQALATMITRETTPTVYVARDGRSSSKSLEQAAIAGLVAAGAEAVRLGLGPTPMLYYAVHSRDGDGGIMITGSHNPPEYNGFKILAGQRTLYGKDIRGIGDIAASGNFTVGVGRTRRESVLEEFVRRLAKDHAGGPLKVAWDAGNGAAGPAMAALVRRLPGEHILLNETVDGTFPNHHPDPMEPKNLRQLQEAVQAHGCDLGVAFDGDGDRIGAVDAKGRILWGDQMLMLFAADILPRFPGATVIADVKASQTLFEHVKRRGGVPLMWKTGHSLIKSKLAETGAPLAGEMSGHLFFADMYFGYDDALYAAVRLIDLVARSGQDLAALYDDLPSMVSTPELRFPCAENRKFSVVEEVKARVAEMPATEIVDIDGVRVGTAEGWWLLRASNTQDVLVARCEGTDEAALDGLKRQLATQLRKSGIHPPAF